MCVSVCVCGCVCTKSHQSRPTLCNPVDHSLSGSSLHGILQARILEWVAVPSRGSSQPRDRTWVCYISCISRPPRVTWEDLHSCYRPQMSYIYQNNSLLFTMVTDPIKIQLRTVWKEQLFCSGWSSVWIWSLQLSQPVWTQASQSGNAVDSQQRTRNAGEIEPHPGQSEPENGIFYLETSQSCKSLSVKASLFFPHYFETKCIFATLVPKC